MTQSKQNTDSLNIGDRDVKLVLTTEQDPLTRGIWAAITVFDINKKKSGLGPARAEAIKSIMELIQLDRIDAKLEELEFCQKYMISTSSFIECVIKPRIDELESLKSGLLKGRDNEA